MHDVGAVLVTSIATAAEAVTPRACEQPKGHLQLYSEALCDIYNRKISFAAPKRRTL